MTEQLSELERVKLENNTLRIALLQNQLQQTHNERAAFLQQLEAAHPGYEWSEQNGRLIPQETEEQIPGYPEFTPH